MKEELEKLLKNSYSPYSNFPVSCIALMKDGKKFSGVNVENASFGLTICAERNAIFNAITNGYKKGDFLKLYVMCDNDKISMCCMACRQVILEFFEQDKEIICMNRKGNEITHLVSEICPFPFNEEDLK